MRQKMVAMVKEAQDAICEGLSAVDGGTFHEDTWDREGGGGGRSRVLQDSHVFEKAGVNVSEVYGVLPPEAVKSMGGGRKLDDDMELNFFATGVSLVVHPKNPMAPTIHMNVRYFERGLEGQPAAWWFGGGIDLTPSYLFEEDAIHFHQTMKNVCDAHDEAYYPKFKQWCDDYFHIKHRQEARGLGGIFFDDLNDREPERLFAFTKDVAGAFLPSYIPIVERRKDMDFTQSQKEWQLMRRGRYVEFNLVYDRGTVFGLKTGGRIESILMSLPLNARWEYDHHPAPDSEEARLLAVLKQPKNWLS